LENLIWNEIERFLCDPGAIIEDLRRRIAVPKSTGNDRSIGQLDQALKSKSNERSRVLGLYRRGAIDDHTLDAQLKEIEGEEAEIKGLMSNLLQSSEATKQGGLELTSVERLLQRLRERLDQGLSWETKRRLVEVLVADVRVNTLDSGQGRKRGEIVVTYRFNEPVATCTGKGSSLPRA
jgi:hypothetical protein